MNELMLFNKELSLKSEHEQSQLISDIKITRKKYKVGIIDVDLQYVMAANEVLGRVNSQVLLYPLIDHNYTFQVGDVSFLTDNMYALPDMPTELFISRDLYLIFCIDEQDSNYLENLKSKINANIGLMQNTVNYVVKVYINIPNMVRYQIVEKEILAAFPEIEIVSVMELSSSFDNTFMIEVPNAAEAQLPRKELFTKIKPLPGKGLLLTMTNSIGKHSERSNYYKLRKFLGDTIYSTDSSESVFARNLVIDYFYSDFLLMHERFQFMFDCPTSIQLGDFFYLPYIIDSIEVKAIVIPLNGKETQRENLIISKSCKKEPVDQDKLLYYLKKSVKNINYSLVCINDVDYRIKSYTVLIKATCLEESGIEKLTYTLSKKIPSPVRFLSPLIEEDAYVYKKAQTYPHFKGIFPHPKTREIILREIDTLESKVGIWSYCNAGLNLSDNLSFVVPLIPLEKLLKLKIVCPIEGFLSSTIPYSWR